MKNNNYFEYTTIIAEGLNKFDNMCNAFARDGWVPEGDVLVAPDNDYYQQWCRPTAYKDAASKFNDIMKMFLNYSRLPEGEKTPYVQSALIAAVEHVLLDADVDPEDDLSSSIEPIYYAIGFFESLFRK